MLLSSQISISYVLEVGSVIDEGAIEDLHSSSFSKSDNFFHEWRFVLNPTLTTDENILISRAAYYTIRRDSLKKRALINSFLQLTCSSALLWKHGDLQ
ncbi:hypothetical protein CEXT_760891 [Caerostris extrusa]|uniref:Uncharacterized protein n=1 Tax=Caerostris extrusa TaxID=172846 RepID=A0AAV4XIZ8_CAEEX|nr:hypothetical protein CEXT_760891 [Caerostris extrusa]